MHYLGSLFFFNDTATTEIYTLSLHDALPILRVIRNLRQESVRRVQTRCVSQLLQTKRGPKIFPFWVRLRAERDRKSTRLNSSHTVISYAVFCLKKKKRNGIEISHLVTERQDI